MVAGGASVAGAIGVVSIAGASVVGAGAVIGVSVVVTVVEVDGPVFAEKTRYPMASSARATMMPTNQPADDRGIGRDDLAEDAAQAAPQLGSLEMTDLVSPQVDLRQQAPVQQAPRLERRIVGHRGRGRA